MWMRSNPVPRVRGGTVDGRFGDVGDAEIVADSSEFPRIAGRTRICLFLE